jgi:hypothetical protein
VGLCEGKALELLHISHNEVTGSVEGEMSGRSRGGRRPSEGVGGTLDA